MMVRRKSYFSRFSSVTRILSSSSWRTWDCLAARCRVTLAVTIWPGAKNLNRRTVSDGDVEEELLSYALRRSLSGMIHGSSRVNSLYRRLCTLYTTSCATYLPTLYTKSIASVPIKLRHGACFVERRCWFTWRAALRRSAVLSRPSRMIKASSVGSNIGATLLRGSGFLALLSASPVKRFSFPFWTEPPTLWWQLQMHGSNPVLRSSVIAGERLGSRRVRLHAPHR
jgi:hypothetical protein